MTRLQGGCLVGLGAALMCAGIAQAAEDRVGPLRLVVVQPVPFSLEEIGRAVAARLALASAGDAGAGGAAPQIRPVSSPPASRASAGELVVGPTDGASVRVVWRDHRVFVPIGAQSGSPAARIVALVIADLSAISPAPPVPDAALPADKGAAELVQDGSPFLPRPSTPLRLTLAGGVARGFRADESVSLDVEADIVGPRWGALRFGVALGTVLIPHQSDPAPDGFSFTGGVARLLAVWRSPLWEVLAGPFVLPYTTGGSATSSGVLFGGSVGARVEPTLSRHVRLVVGLRADGYANGIHATWTSRSGFATPRVAAALTVGAAWELGS